MKKIVLITPFLQPYRITFYEKLAKINKDYELTVFHGVKNVEDGRPGHKGSTNFNEQGFTELKRLIGPYEFVYNKGMLKALKEINPDVVIMQLITANISLQQVMSWAKKNNKKSILWVCGWEPERVKGFFVKFKNIFVNKFICKADYFLTYSNNASKYIQSFNVEKSIVETCYNGVEIDEMIKNEDKIIEQSLTVKKELGLDGFITFCYVGGFHAEKRIDMLVDAYVNLKKKYKNIKLLLIGDGPTRKAIEEQMSLHNDPDMKYLGRIIDGVDPYFAAADCLVLPGVGGLALNQAMFWKKLCVVSEADGTEDDLVIEGESGYRFEKHNLETLIAAMERRINESPEKLEKMGEKAKELIETKSNVTNMVKVFDRGISKFINN